MAFAHSFTQSAPASGKTTVGENGGGKARSGGTALQYQRSQIETASPARLVVMLYDGAIRFCQLALDAMAKQDIETQHTNLLRVQRIVAELLGSLNREVGGEVADNLARLYMHMLEELVLANLQDDAPAVNNVQAMLRDLRESWVEADRVMAQAAPDDENTSIGTEARKTTASKPTLTLVQTSGAKISDIVNAPKPPEGQAVVPTVRTGGVQGQRARAMQALIAQANQSGSADTSSVSLSRLSDRAA